MRKFYHYSPGDSSSESGFEESLCTGSPSRTEAVYDRNYPCHRSLYDPPKRHCCSGSYAPDPAVDPDGSAWSHILWIQKGNKGRHFPNPSDLYFCCRRDCCLRIINRNADPLIKCPEAAIRKAWSFIGICNEVVIVWILRHC